MNWDQIEGNFKQLGGKIKSQWGKLTDDDVTNASGKKDHFVGLIQERYGILKDEAEKQVDTWLAKLDGALDKATEKVKESNEKAKGDVSVKGDVSASRH
ncbi:MAG: CsbD family protein [Polyangiaceae bacterium]